ncbi:MAG: UDP-N-acetylmuramate--L-alanine ligase [Rubrobacteraceae bacterium]|uniref:UDP-N-acetylmuramate--L-alanine ligase n=1 Tax=Rubrobacter naiadicus TaxID=1392641 RepID=UPI002362AB1E|nr:UDP-N-acetylmuramate--L-alanine ligase [Rubrobacter naiadicus]MCL6437386.1 UDP-N-acetylmuramate--L-alanine ligase [Rubrobacteraceae bacterium]
MRIHMVGIGGAGMSGIAQILHARGHEVTGSDLKESSYTKRLREAGVPVVIGHDASNVGEAEVVVVSTAIPKTNPEVLEARRRDIPVIPRAQALAKILEGKRGIAVAGTHGKTTTTSMIAHALRVLGENPTALVGGELNDIGSNALDGAGELVVAEADESDRSLLYLRPEAAVVTNVEFDHPDFYHSLDDVLETFSRFVGGLPEDGLLVTCAEDERCLKLASRAPCEVVTYGISGGELRARILGPNRYVLLEDGKELGEVELGVFGRHNVLNSLAATAVARWLGHDAYEAARTLATFSGVRRRFQLKGVRSNIRVVDDYAHHPTELAATLEVARATLEPGGRVIAVFQPHRYSRTRRLYREFGGAFSAADAVLVTEVYGAGEMPLPGVNGKLIVDAICDVPHRPEVYYLPELNVIPRVLREICESGDTVLTLGAGDVSRVGDELLAIL